MLQRLNLKWANQGDVHWQKDWTTRHGYTRTHIPGLAEHVSFANYDLQRAGLPQIEQGSQGELYVEFDVFGLSGLPRNAGLAFAYSVAGQRILDVVKGHGFEPLNPGLRRK